MRWLPLLLLVGCTDAAEVPTTVVHIDLNASCATPDCYLYSDVFNDSCGPIGSSEITPQSRSITVLTSDDAEDIDALVQLQYSDAQQGSAHVDQVLKAGEKTEVYSAYDYELLYRITSDGEVVDLDSTKLVMASGNTLHFAYTFDGIGAEETHVIDAPVPVHLETDDPGIMDACCSAGRPREGLLVLVALGLVLRRRRT